MQELRAKFSLNISDSLKSLSQLKSAMSAGLSGLSALVNQRKQELNSLQPTLAKLGGQLKTTFEMRGIRAANLATILKPQQDAIANLKKAMGEYQTHLTRRTAAQTIRRDPFGDTLQEQTRAWQARQFSLAMNVAKARRAAERAAPTDDQRAVLKADAAAFEASKTQAQLAAKAIRDYNAAKAQQAVMVKGVTGIEAAGGGSIMARLTATKQATAELGRLLSTQVKAGTITKQIANQTLAPFRNEVKRTEVEAKKLAETLRQARENSRHWRMNPPPVVPTTVGGKLRMAFSQVNFADVASYLPGRAGMAGSAFVGGATGAALGSLIGMGIGMAISGFHRLFETIKSGVIDVLSTARSLQNLSAQTGIKPGAGAVISRAAQMAEIDPKAFSLWFSRFQANIGTVGKTPPLVADALVKLKQYGLPTQVELRKMPPESALKALASAFESIRDKNLRAALAMDLFNRQGAEMLRIFENPQLIREAAQQVGALADVYNKSGDAMAFQSRALEGLTEKRRGFFAGLIGEGTAFGNALADASNKFNAVAVGTGVRKVLGNLTGLGIALKPLFLLLDLMGKDIKPANVNLADATDFVRYPEMKGLKMEPGDAYSRIGAFSSPGVMKQMPVQIADMNRKKVELLTAIKDNTANLRTPKVSDTGTKTFSNAPSSAITVPGKQVPPVSTAVTGQKPKLGNLPDLSGMNLPSAIQSPATGFSMATAENFLSTIARNTSPGTEKPAIGSTNIANRLAFAY